MPFEHLDRGPYLPRRPPQHEAISSSTRELSLLRSCSIIYPISPRIQPKTLWALELSIPASLAYNHGAPSPGNNKFERLRMDAFYRERNPQSE